MPAEMTKLASELCQMSHFPPRVGVLVKVRKGTSLCSEPAQLGGLGVLGGLGTPGWAGRLHGESLHLQWGFPFSIFPDVVAVFFQL